MEPSPTSGSPAARFTPYLEELREFLLSRQLAVGRPEDLGAFVERLNRDAAFHEEMVSLVRSVVFREGGALPSVDIAKLLTLATGGPEAEDPPASQHQAFRTVFVFATEIVRSLRRNAAADLNPENAIQEVEVHVGSTPAAALSEVFQTFASEPAEHAPEEARFRNDRLAWALSQDVTVEQDWPPAQEPAAASPPVSVLGAKPTPRTSLGMLLQRWYWVPGVCLMVAAIAISMTFLRRSTRAPARVVSLPSASLPKPTAYGPALASGGVQGQALPQAAIEAPVPERGRSDAPPTATRSQATGAVPAFTLDPENAKAPGPGWDHKPATPSIRPLPTTSIPDPREGVFLASSGSMAGHLQFAPAPGYPRLANFAHVQGQVLLQVVVARDGSVAATHVLQGPHLLRGAAEHAVRQWRYRPYVVDGRATDVATLVTVIFRLRN